MRQWGTITRLAIHEMWITFRMLIMLVAFVAAGAVAALLAAPPTIALSRLALGLGVATAMAGAVAAWSIAVERTSGRIGWLVTRSLSRGTYVLGWYVALTAIMLAGLTASAALGWLTISTAAPGTSRGAYVAAIAAIGSGGLGAIALGLVAGAFLPAAVAAFLTAAVAGGAAAVGFVVTPMIPVPPGAGMRLLPGVASSSAELPTILRATGVGLVTAAVLVVVARLLIERAEL